MKRFKEKFSTVLFILAMSVMTFAATRYESDVVVFQNGLGIGDTSSVPTGYTAVVLITNINAGILTGTVDAAVQSNITILGTIAEGVWNGTAIGDGYITKSGDWTGTFDGQEGSYYLTAGNLSGTLAAGVQANITQVGTIASGVWNGTAIGDGYITKSGDWTGTLDGQEGAYYRNRANHTNTLALAYNSYQDLGSITDPTTWTVTENNCNATMAVAVVLSIDIPDVMTNKHYSLGMRLTCNGNTNLTFGTAGGTTITPMGTFYVVDSKVNIVSFEGYGTNIYVTAIEEE